VTAPRRLVSALTTSRLVTTLEVVLLCAIGVWAYAPILDMPPFSLDNVAELMVAQQASVWDLLTGPFIHSVAGYRPLPHTTAIAQYDLVGASAEPYFAVNVACAALAGLVLYAFVRTVTRDSVAAVAAGAAFLVDPRIHQALIAIGERQATIGTCLAGGALIVAYGVALGRLRSSRLTLAGLGALLLAAMLSKEFALAAAVGVAGVGILHRSRSGAKLVVVAIAATAVYFAMRYGLAGGATGAYCESEGFLMRTRDVCVIGPGSPGFLSLHGGALIAQWAWNVAAGAIGAFFPFLLRDEGALARDSFSSIVDEVGLGTIAFYVSVAALASFAWIRRARIALPLLAVVAASAVLNFLVYRPRNELMGMFAVYGSAAIGLVEILHPAQAVRALASRRRLQAATVPVVAVGCLLALMSVWAVQRADVLRTKIDKHVQKDDRAGATLCTLLGTQYRINLRIVTAIKRQYDLPNADCSRPETKPVKDKA
jgi:hypothetical protein